MTHPRQIFQGTVSCLASKKTSAFPNLCVRHGARAGMDERGKPPLVVSPTRCWAIDRAPPPQKNVFVCLGSFIRGMSSYSSLRRPRLGRSNPIYLSDEAASKSMLIFQTPPRQTSFSALDHPSGMSGYSSPGRPQRDRSNPIYLSDKASTEPAASANHLRRKRLRIPWMIHQGQVRSWQSFGGGGAEPRNPPKSQISGKS